MDPDRNEDSSGEPEADDWVCPVPMAHDRYTEADYFLHRMEAEYHNPQVFRFNLNAYVSALRAVHSMLERELERAGHIQWWKQRRQEFANDPVLARFTRGRNIALHQRALVEGSQITIGLFRERRLKLAGSHEIRSDETSQQLLTRMLPYFVKFLIDEEHMAIGEQIGVQRLYFVKELSNAEDVLRASRRALARTTKALSEAHNRFGGKHEALEDYDVLRESALDEVTVLLETDIDPDAAKRWGWIEDDDSVDGAEGTGRPGDDGPTESPGLDQAGQHVR
jgi:hypothetical protein